LTDVAQFFDEAGVGRAQQVRIVLAYFAGPPPSAGPTPLQRQASYVALVNVGGYGSAAASNHCMRGACREFLLPGDD